jgi:hypothetical protein
MEQGTIHKVCESINIILFLHIRYTHEIPGAVSGNFEKIVEALEKVNKFLQCILEEYNFNERICK